jgi:hypothetical protein
VTDTNAPWSNYPPPAYPPPAYQPPYQPAPPSKSTNGLAIASLVLGVLWIWGLGSILAVIFGYVSLRQIRQRGENGHGLALAGLILGIVGVVGAILLTVLIIVAAATTPSGCFYNNVGDLVCN